MNPTKAAFIAPLLFVCACSPTRPSAREPVTITEAAPPASAPPAPSTPPGPAQLMSTPRQDIAALERLLAQVSPGSPDRPKLLRRLAEAYARLATAQRVQALRGADAAAVKKAEQRARAAHEKAIGYYAALAREHPNFCSGSANPARAGCVDEVLFYLAYEHEQLGQLEEARQAYAEIIKRFPQSRFVPNAYLASAERAFEEGGIDPARLVEAARLYQKVLAFPPPDNKVAAYAHYKLAWVHFNRGDRARATDELKKAIDVAEKYPSIPGSAQLAKAARRDLSSVVGP